MAYPASEPRRGRLAEGLMELLADSLWWCGDLVVEALGVLLRLAVRAAECACECVGDVL